MSDKKDIPRFVLSVTDTKTTMTGPKGDQYLMISVGADSLSAFNKPLPLKDQTPVAATELQRLFYFFQEQVDKSDAQRKGTETVKYTKVGKKTDKPE